MFLVASSALATVAGDVICNVLAQVESEVTYPSLADAFFLLRYPILVAGLLVVVRKRTPGRQGRRPRPGHRGRLTFPQVRRPAADR